MYLRIAKVPNRFECIFRKFDIENFVYEIYLLDNLPKNGNNIYEIDINIDEAINILEDNCLKSCKLDNIEAFVFEGKNLNDLIDILQELLNTEFILIENITNINANDILDYNELANIVTSKLENLNIDLEDIFLIKKFSNFIKKKIKDFK
uniref:Uncharacterized protein n=1 Tax=Pithovirus LCDPAC02 TaxID=2506601 RepID=A0A481YP86_9VIRU|nr:MAG: hypothetical protein LCDPAC02_00790 [Pithovirus LCDPAC02]